MKYILIICFASIALINISYGQNIIKLKELISISETDIGTIDDLMTKKNFTFLGEKKNDTEDLSEYSWRHFENFTLIISVYRCKDTRFNLDGSAYFFEGVEIFNSLKTECATLGFKKTEAYTKNNSFYSIYKNDKYTIEFNSRSKPGRGAWYAVAVNIIK